MKKSFNKTKYNILSLRKKKYEDKLDDINKKLDEYLINNITNVHDKLKHPVICNDILCEISSYCDIITKTKLKLLNKTLYKRILFDDQEKYEYIEKKIIQYKKKLDLLSREKYYTKSHIKNIIKKYINKKDNIDHYLNKIIYCEEEDDSENYNCHYIILVANFDYKFKINLDMTFSNYEYTDEGNKIYLEICFNNRTIFCSCNLYLSCLDMEFDNQNRFCGDEIDLFVKNNIKIIMLLERILEDKYEEKIPLLKLLTRKK